MFRVTRYLMISKTVSGRVGYRKKYWQQVGFGYPLGTVSDKCQLCGKEQWQEAGGTQSNLAQVPQAPHITTSRHHPVLLTFKPGHESTSATTTTVPPDHQDQDQLLTVPLADQEQTALPQHHAPPSSPPSNRLLDKLAPGSSLQNNREDEITWFCQESFFNHFTSQFHLQSKCQEPLNHKLLSYETPTMTANATPKVP